ncbi:MAG: Gfo/Idh/MocA family oxidoreductase [Candidatus Omnitrophica bacterium]|nr:Gfo/Idh/MocA family oxidoreductase [Candidatus Omnitrophota bacterium]
MKKRVAVIGVGHLGSQHARIYSKLKDVELVGVCDLSPKRARKVAKNYRTQYFTDWRKLAKMVDAVSIATPTVTHFEVAKGLIELGINILIEKPMTSTVEEADELLFLAKENNLILQVGHIERFNSAVRAIEQYQGKVGFIECHRLAPYKKRSLDVGVVLDLMIHDIDIILDLVGSEIENISAIGIPILTKHEDLANARLTFQNGAVANITASRVSNKEMRKIRIFRENAYISLDYVRQDAQIYTKEGKRIKRKRINIKKEEPLKLELESFIHCLHHKKKPLVSGIEGRRALEAALEITNIIHRKK